MLDLSRRSLLATTLAAPLASAQDWARKAVDASPRKRNWATIPQGSRKIETFVAQPEGSAKVPAMIVIHEIFGLSDWVESVTDEFAAAGFLAVAPDLLSGLGPNGGRTKDFIVPEGQGPMATPAVQAVRALPQAQVAADLDAIMEFCRKQPRCNGKVCVVGFSWGGSQSFQFATRHKDLTASLVFYGGSPAKETLSGVAAPVYGFYGGADARVNASIAPTQEAMKELGKKYEPVIYEGAAHGFMRSGAAPDAKEPDIKARQAAWTAIKKLREQWG